MAKHTEKVKVYDPKVRTRRGAYLEIEAPQTVLPTLVPPDLHFQYYSPSEELRRDNIDADYYGA